MNLGSHAYTEFYFSTLGFINWVFVTLSRALTECIKTPLVICLHEPEEMKYTNSGLQLMIILAVDESDDFFFFFPFS